MIFAAGLGTRLAPLTDSRPKALVEFLGKTMLENVALRIVEAGYNKLVINIHHFPELMREFIRNHDFGAEVVISDESDMLLDTGGGIVKAQDWLSKENDFLLYNVDVASNLDLEMLRKAHLETGNLATLAVKDRTSTRKLIFDEGMNLCAWKNLTTSDTKISREVAPEKAREFAFSGISMVSRDIFPLITESGKFSITNLYLRLAKDCRIGGFIDNSLWADLGTVEKLKKAEALFSGTSLESAEC